MGIDQTGLRAVLNARRFQPLGHVLMLGRQGIHLPEGVVHMELEQEGIVTNGIDFGSYAETLFRCLGATAVESLDASSYEGATHVWDLNKPLPGDIFLQNRFQFIFDGGTTEHIFHQPQLYDTVISLLQEGGLYCSVTTNNNFSGHGFYQYSPEFFYGIMQPQYGMQLLGLWLTKTHEGGSVSNWVSLTTRDEIQKARNTTMFSDGSQTYIVCLARKICKEPKMSLLQNPPQQKSYEQIDWKKIE